MRGGERVAAAALLAALAAGCSGSSGTPEDAAPSTSTTPPTSPAALPHRGGLVGAIDSARLVSFCANVRLATTAAEGGLGGAAVRQALDGALDVLRQSPRSPELQATVARWSALRQRVGDQATVKQLQAYCERQGE